MPQSGEPTVSLRFVRPPSLMRAYLGALKRKPTALDAEQTIPSMEATLEPTRPDPAHLAAFMAVCAQPPTDQLPLTYLHVLASPLHAQLLCAAAFPLRAMGLVHASNLITAWRPIHPGELIGLHVHISGHRMIQQHTAFDLITTASVGAETVWEETTTILSPGPSERRDGPRPQPEAGLEHAPTRSAAWALDEGLGRRYAAMSGDYNPIHLHSASARLLGQRRAIIHGMWTAARVVAALDDQLVRWPRSQRIDFKRPIALPARVICSTWPDPEPHDDDATRLRFDVRSADGLRVHAVGEASSG
jgi:acyl dehydratase